MNEKVAQLAEQAAQESALLENDMNLEVSVNDESYMIPANFIERFSELIVRECANILDDEDTGDAYGKSVRLAMIRIKQHFGVEE